MPAYKYAKHLPRRRWPKRVGIAVVLTLVILVAGASMPPVTTLAAPPGIAAPAVSYDAPLTIRSGGVYVGSWTALTVDTTEAVTIRNAAFKGADGNLLTLGSGANVTVEDSYFEGRRAADNDYRAIWAPEGVGSLTVRNNDFVGIAAIKVQNASGSIRILNNRARDIIGDPANGSRPGYVNGGGYAQFVQLAWLSSPNAEIAWNEVINVPERSRVEDNISLYDAGGASAAAPMRIHDNFVWGAFPLNSTVVQDYSGGGIMLGDGDSGRARHVVVEDNQVVGTTNYGISIVCGTAQIVRNNTVLSSGRQADGQALAAANTGLGLWHPDYCSNSGNTMTDNRVGWVRWENSRWPCAGCRADWWAPDAGANTFANTSIEGEITYASEQAEYQAWVAKSAGQRVGRAAGPLSTTTTGPTSSSTTTTTTGPPASPTTGPTPPPVTTAPPTTAPPVTTTLPPPTTAPPPPSTTVPPPPSAPTIPGWVCVRYPWICARR
ncbi:MAG TPA: hypothetical protein VIY72_15500 [Acidimicrobiales bacterium]